MSYIYSIFLFLCLISCNSGNNSSDIPATEEKIITFDREKWAVKQGMDYPYREDMLEDLVYNVQLKGLSEDSLLALLGSPTRTENSYFYYMVAQERLGFYPIHSIFLVIKFNEQGKVEWRKIHQ